MSIDNFPRTPTPGLFLSQKSSRKSSRKRKSSKRRWLPKSFSVDKDDMPVFERLAREAKASKPRVTESSLLVQILKDHFFVIDSVAEAAKINGHELIEVQHKYALSKEFERPRNSPTYYPKRRTR